MNILEAQRTLTRLAKLKGVPTSEIEKEIADAVQYACQYGDESTKSAFKMLFGEDKVPTPAEMLMHLTNKMYTA